MIIVFQEHEFLLHHTGALYWPSERMLIASDLHLEKGSHYARRGFFLPPYDSLQSLSLLLETCKMLRAQRLLLLGDAFHDNKGLERLGRKERALFEGLQAYTPIWIRGNHDNDIAPPGFLVSDTHIQAGIAFRHETTCVSGADISGHYHPKVTIRQGRGGLSRPCFIEDGQKMILPAFGAYTGGLDITDAAIASLLDPAMRVYALGKERVYRIGDERKAG